MKCTHSDQGHDNVDGVRCHDSKRNVLCLYFSVGEDAVRVEEHLPHQHNHHSHHAFQHFRVQAQFCDIAK